MVAAERIRLGINHHPLRLGDTTLNITASMGVTTLPLEANSIQEALTLTRLGLQRSKLGGKNRVSGRPSATSEAGHRDAPSDLVADLRRRTFALAAHDDINWMRHGRLKEASSIY